MWRRCGGDNLRKAAGSSACSCVKSSRGLESSGVPLRSNTRRALRARGMTALARAVLPFLRLCDSSQMRTWYGWG